MKQSVLGKLFDNSRPDSYVSRLRQKRWENFRSLTSSVPRPMRILDIGGSQTVWERIGFADSPDIHITILNLDKMPTDHANIVCLQGDACCMPQFPDKSFDIVFSNSLIEHVGDEVRVRQMAEETRRVGKRYYLQTPNKYFPMEPHFCFPMFQFLPIGVRTTLVQHFSLGFIPKRPVRAQAEAEVASIRLLTKREVKQLFPEAHIEEERLFGMTKSIQAYRFAELN